LANIINGTDTGSGGLITTGDSSDELQLQTAETTALTINSSQNVGIGTSSPSVKFEVNGRVLGESVVAGNALYVWSQNRMSLGASYGIESQQSSPFFLLTNSAQPIVFGTNNAERMRLTSDGYLRMASGSGGIQFNGDTAAANALNDYEAGTWTPTDASGAGLTLSVAGTPRYVKIGRFVFFNVGLITYPSTANGSGASVGGLPFTVDSNNHGTLSFVATTANASAGLSVANTTEIFFYANGTTSRSTNANLSGAQIYGISGCYQVP
jgi:hypothetical protein